MKEMNELIKKVKSEENEKTILEIVGEKPVWDIRDFYSYVYHQTNIGLKETGEVLEKLKNSYVVDEFKCIKLSEKGKSILENGYDEKEVKYVQEAKRGMVFYYYDGVNGIAVEKRYSTVRISYKNDCIFFITPCLVRIRSFTKYDNVLKKSVFLEIGGGKGDFSLLVSNDKHNELIEAISEAILK
jgi:hypothetical protein